MFEIDLTKRLVCQARGKCIRLPQDGEREVMQQWLTQEGLKVAESMRL